MWAFTILILDDDYNSRDIDMDGHKLDSNTIKKITITEE